MALDQQHLFMIAMSGSAHGTEINAPHGRGDIRQPGDAVNSDGITKLSLGRSPVYVEVVFNVFSCELPYRRVSLLPTSHQNDAWLEWRIFLLIWLSGRRTGRGSALTHRLQQCKLALCSCRGWSRRRQRVTDTYQRIRQLERRGSMVVGDGPFLQTIPDEQDWR